MNVKHRGRLYAIALGLGLLSASAAHAQMTININANASLASNAQALAAFQRAAAQWSSRFTDNITIDIDAGLASLGGSIIGSTDNVVVANGYDVIRNAMVADEVGNPLLAALPTAAQFTATMPSGGTLDGLLSLSKANAKALGFTGLPAGADGTITFSSDFAFDFDNSNGVTPGTMDFETVAAHEIGHLLGFFSVVDVIDEGTITNISPTTLDLFRFDAASSPTTLSTFTTAPRDLRPGGTKVTSSADQNFFRNSGGSPTANLGMSTGRFQGDGNQASHWKSDDATGVTIGIMDPTLSFGQMTPVGFNDLVAMSLIGYNLAAVPEPSSLVLLLTPGVLLFLKRRKAESGS